MSESFLCRQEPHVCWWPELEVNGRTVYDLVLVGEDDRAEWFLLVFGGKSKNPAWVRKRMRTIAVPKNAHEVVPYYVRSQALEWLESECATEEGRRLREDLRRWQQRSRRRSDGGHSARHARRRALRFKR